jgi:hypothetical protein
VTFSGRIAGRGVVVVDHGAVRTTYEPVSATVRTGDLVGVGTTIGTLELFGSHCFPDWCLHWGLIQGREHYLDPLTLVGAAPVVLLPLGSAPVSAPAATPLLPQTSRRDALPPMVLRPASPESMIGLASLGPTARTTGPERGRRGGRSWE